GLKLALRDAEIDHVAAGVGDRLVMEEMKNLGSSIGGEESGHIIFLDLHTTGDGILAALQLLTALGRTGQKLSDLSTLMTVYPQTLLNLEVKSKPEIKDIPDLLAIIGDIECMLGEEGRVLVRYSGTEPVCRIMVEGKDQKEIEDYARRIGDVVLSQLG
ncbi:MAG: phosphoglucosamine mutase, partial [Deltaproteobacteria bacterium]|nr:phosphoglucosamine mutase [Deltaproteobacteria bacterium]